MGEYQKIDDQIENLEKQKKSFQDEIDELKQKKKRLLEIDNISHSQAVDKLRDIWISANQSEDARDFIVDIVRDKQLLEWFGEVDNGWA